MRQIIKNTYSLKMMSYFFMKDDMSKRELTRALNQIVRKVKVNTLYDVPFLAGYSKDAKTIYIDKRIPKFLTYKNKKFNIYRFLILHEIIEKTLIDHLGPLNYNLAHEIASRAEYAAITGEEFSYTEYNQFIQEKLAEIRCETNYTIPPDLDLKPYYDAKDETLIKRIKKSLKINWINKKNYNLQINSKPNIIRHSIKIPISQKSNKVVVIYQHALMLNQASIQDVKKFIRKNGWHDIWVNGMYPYHHYHSNVHEALIIFSGQCEAQIGGPKGKKLTVSTGDVIFFPAGVSHKKIRASKDFKSIGCYPYAIPYDLKLGTPSNNPATIANLKKVKLPKTDPIYGAKGFLFRLWKS